MTKVSVLIPVYNNKTDILNAIQSVINQTYKDWEMIVIDDASNDGTYELVQKFIADNNYNNIILIKNDRNKGVYVSLNEGLVRAKGEYICRVDSDDTIIPTYFQICSNFLDKNPNIIAMHCLYQRSLGKPRYGEITLFYRKNIINRIGYYDSVRFRADTEFTERLYRTFGKKKIYHIRKVVYHATIRKGSITQSPITGNSIIRKDYVRKYRRWHRRKKYIYMPYPLKKRPFNVNRVMLP